LETSARTEAIRICRAAPDGKADAFSHHLVGVTPELAQLVCTSGDVTWADYANTANVGHILST
jgi:hypothetical protein